MAIDFLLDEDHDLFFGGTDFALAKDSTETIQSVKIRILFMKGEWVSAFTMGVAWVEEMFNSNVSYAVKRQRILTTLINTVGLDKVLEFKFDIDLINRGARIEFKATTIFNTTITGVVEV